MLSCEGPSRVGGVAFPFLGGQASSRASQCPVHRNGIAQRRDNAGFQPSGLRGGGSGGRRGRASRCLLRPPGSFYTFREVGLILSSSPTDCSCCCCCSDPADHVAWCDLDAAKLGAGRSGCSPHTGGRRGQWGQRSLWLQQLGAFAYVPSFSLLVHPFRELGPPLTS